MVKSVHITSPSSFLFGGHCMVGKMVADFNPVVNFIENIWLSKTGELGVDV